MFAALLSALMDLHLLVSVDTGSLVMSCLAVVIAIVAWRRASAAPVSLGPDPVATLVAPVSPIPGPDPAPDPAAPEPEAASPEDLEPDPAAPEPQATSPEAASVQFRIPQSWPPNGFLYKPDSNKKPTPPQETRKTTSTSKCIQLIQHNNEHRMNTLLIPQSIINIRTALA